jgi:hypothetical protein
MLYRPYPRASPLEAFELSLRVGMKWWRAVRESLTTLAIDGFETVLSRSIRISSSDQAIRGPRGRRSFLSLLRDWVPLDLGEPC